MNRIGPKMLAATAFVAANPGCAILPVAQYLHVGARTGRANSYGYNPVHRALAAGLIVATMKRGRYSLTVTAHGLEALA